MPIVLENKLKKAAKHLGLNQERANAYVYGTMAKIAKRMKRKQ